MLDTNTAVCITIAYSCINVIVWIIRIQIYNDHSVLIIYQRTGIMRSY